MTQPELIFYINLLEDLNNGKKPYVNYETLRKDLLVEFGVKTTIENIRKLFKETLSEPTIEDEQEDLKIIYNNVC